MRCADFQRSKLKCCTPKAMNIFRIFFLVPMMGMWTKIFIDNPMGPTYFETQWGYLFTCMSLFSSVMTIYSPWWQSIAVVTTELATCFNVCIMSITWGLLMPPIIKAWSKMVVDPLYGNWWLYSMVWDHTIPMIMISI